MKTREKIKIGDVRGNWTIINGCPDMQQGRKWLCRCSCGTERYVLERSLVYGYSLSCGCVKKAYAPADELKPGVRFGDLTVIKQLELKDRRYSVRWQCRCTCGNIIDTAQRKLLSGSITNCGCMQKQTYMDITGRSFGRLSALYPLQATDARGSKLWHCQCECGTELDVSYNTLLYSNTCSCGCKKKENDQVLRESLSHVAGTSIDHIRSKKVPSNNTSGIRGVCQDKRGRYIARIVFQKKQYWLGAYATLEEAAEARKEAEQVINDQVAEYYAKWKHKADADPEWAEANPVQIDVQKHSGRIEVVLLPEIE